MLDVSVVVAPFAALVLRVLCTHTRSWCSALVKVGKTRPQNSHSQSELLDALLAWQ